MRPKYAALCLVIALLFALFFLPRPVHAANVSISGPSEGHVGKTVTVNLGFPAVDTVSFDITLQFDSNLLAYSSAGNRSGLEKFNVHPSSNQVIVGAFDFDKTVTVSNAASVTFKVLGKGMAEIAVIAGSDGHSNLGGGKIAINLVDPPAATTKPTVATSKTSTVTTTTVPVETEPRHPADTTIGKRYDGVALAVPETSPGEEGLPASYSPQELKWEDKHLLAYVSEPLPWTLYWLADESGAARFYYQDEETSVFVPYYRAEWSARYFTFTVLAEDQVPEGFEVATLKARDIEVPGYRPQEDHYFSKAVYDSLLAGEEIEGEELPADLFLVACHVNESEEKKLYLFDQDLDSMIRAGLWIVPLAGSVLDPTVDPEPEPTEPLPSEPAGDQNPDRSAKAVNLFGLSVPLAFLAGAGALILILLALILFLFIRARRAAVTPELTMEDLAEEDRTEDLQEEAEDGSARPEVREPEGLLGIGLTQPVEPVDLDLPEEEEALPEYEEGVEEAVEEEEARVTESEEGWAALEDTLREHEEKRPPGRSSRRRPPGIRPSTHRRPERDDPADPDEL